MAEQIKLGWLKDNNGEKFAPKTLMTQVQAEDGTLIEDKIRNDINTARDESKVYTDTIAAGKADAIHNHDDAYYTKIEMDEALSATKEKDLIVTYQEGSISKVTHSSQEIVEAVNNGQTVKFQKSAELLNLLEADTNYATFYMVYVNMDNKLQQKIVVVSGDSVVMEQDDIYDYATVSALNLKQDKLTGTNGQLVQFNASGIPIAVDPIFITVDEIDTICGSTIEIINANNAIF